MTTKKTKLIHPELHHMDREDLNQEAVTMLDTLLECCTMHLVSELTGISRTTLYKWTDESVSLEAMSHRDSMCFILMCETDPKLIGVLTRGPVSHPRMAKRLVEEGDSNAASD